MHYFVKDKRKNEYVFKTLLQAEMHIVNSISAMKWGYDHFTVGFNTIEKVVYPTAFTFSYYTESGAYRNVAIYRDRVSIDSYWNMRRMVLDMMEEFKDAMMRHYDLKE